MADLKKLFRFLLNATKNIHIFWMIITMLIFFFIIRKKFCLQNKLSPHKIIY